MSLRQFMALTETYDRVDVRRTMVAVLTRERVLCRTLTATGHG